MTSTEALVLAWFAAVVGPPVAAWALWRLWRAGSRHRVAVVGLMVGIGWAAGVWGFLIEPVTLTVRDVTVKSPQWRGPPLRIGLISDTHAAAPHVDGERVRRIVGRMNAERPDIVLLLGDYTGGHLPSTERSEADRARVLDGIAAFEGLDAPLGTKAVLGNHDSWFDDVAIAGALGRAGVEVLEDRATFVTRPGGGFWVGGVADMHSPRYPASVRRTLSNVPADTPVLVITHWPDPFEDVPPRVALTMAGHTHCGQVNLPLIGRPILPSPASYRWPCGVYDVGGRKLFVTGGVGVSSMPVRFRAPPEIVVLTLRAPAS